jgi:hypothetical protein
LLGEGRCEALCFIFACVGFCLMLMFGKARCNTFVLYFCLHCDFGCFVFLLRRVKDNAQHHGLLTIELIKLCYQIWAYKCEKVIHYRRMLFFILEENVGMAMAMQKTQGC